MAYAIQSRPDGSVLYSDGSVRWPQSTQPDNQPLSQYDLEKAKIADINAQFPQGFTDPYYGKQVVQPADQMSDDLTANVLRNKFGFNDPNVIQSILNDPTRRQSYLNELGSTAGDFSQTQPTYSKSDLTGILTSGTSESSGFQRGFGDKLAGLFGFERQEEPVIGDAYGEQQISDWFGDQGVNLGTWSWKGYNLPDFGATEAYAGGLSGGRTSDLGESLQYASSDLQKAYRAPSSEDPTVDEIRQSRQPQKAVPVGTSEDGSIMMSDGTTKPYEEIFGELRGEVDRVKQGDFGIPDTIADDQGTDEIFALIDESKDEGIQTSMDLAEIQKMLLDNQYQNLLANYDSLVPQYERYAQEGVEDLQTGLGRLQETGREQKGDIKETYGERLASSVKNAQQLENKRRRMFSSLGTAESSAFIEEQGRADRNLMENIQENQEAMQNKIQEIDKQLLQAEEDVNTQAERIQRDAQEKIMAVQMAKNATRGEKLAEIGKINASLRTSLNELQNQWANQKIGVLQQKQALQNTLASIRAQGLVDENLLKTQSDLQNEAYTLNTQAASEPQEAIEGVIKLPTSDALRLMNKYPSWSEILGDVRTGVITPEEGLAKIQELESGSYSEQLASTS